MYLGGLCRAGICGADVLPGVPHAVCLHGAGEAGGAAQLARVAGDRLHPVHRPGEDPRGEGPALEGEEEQRSPSEGLESTSLSLSLVLFSPCLSHSLTR